MSEYMRSATEAARMLRAKQVSVTELVERCYARIDQIQSQTDALVSSCRERALKEATDADALLGSGTPAGPLQGVPFTVADSFVMTGMDCTGDTSAREGLVPDCDATVVARVRAAGGILLGRTNASALTHGGAAAIVAAGGAYFDIGAECHGGIRNAAAASGIAALKPTFGRVPRTGHIAGYGGPYDSFRGVGPLVRHVADLQLLLEILSGPDDWDAAMVPVPLGDPAAVRLGGLRVAYYLSNAMLDPTPEIQDLVEQCAGRFAQLGSRVTRDRPPLMAELAEARANFTAASLIDVRRLPRRHDTESASFGVRLAGELPSAEFTRYCEVMDAIRSEQLAWFEQYDLIICPAGQCAPSPPTGDPPDGKSGWRANYTSQFNTTGWPAGVVRAGTSKSRSGLPLGVQVVAPPWREDIAIAAMAHIEQSTVSDDHRRSES